MFKQMLIGLCALTLAGAGFTTVLAADTGSKASLARAIVATTSAPATEKAAASDSTVILAVAIAASAPAAEKAPAVDVKNTKCIVQSDEDATEKTLEYNGKLYHICCAKCTKIFNKDPEKFVKALEADPASYGIKAAK